MARRKEQFRKQQIATSGHSNKSLRRMKALAEKINRIGMLKLQREKGGELVNTAVEKEG